MVKRRRRRSKGVFEISVRMLLSAQEARTSTSLSAVGRCICMQSKVRINHAGPIVSLRSAHCRGILRWSCRPARSYFQQSHLIGTLKSIASALIIAVFCQTPAIAVNELQPDQTVKLSNGATATSYHNCGDMDLCARIVDADGSVLSIYSEGAAMCQPYFLHFVLQNAGGVTQFEFSRMVNHTDTKDKSCGHTVPTQMVLDHGAVHLTVIETTEGTLSLVFSATH